MEQERNHEAAGANGTRDPVWHNVRMRAEDFAHLEREAKRVNLSVSACLQRIIKRDRSVGAVHAMIESLAEQIRGVERFSVKSASDLTARLRRIEAGVGKQTKPYRTRIATADGTRFEDVDRHQLLMAVQYARDIAEHLVPECVETVGERADQEMDRLYGLDTSDDAAEGSEEAPDEPGSEGEPHHAR